MDYVKMRELLDDYNSNPDKYNDREAEVIAMIARQTGQHFRRESKPIRKGLYQAGEMASFGLLPDSWEPHSRGENVFGQTTIDKIASGAGMVAGVGGGIYGAYKGAKGAYGMTKSFIDPKDKVKRLAQKMSQAGVNLKDKGLGVVGRFGDKVDDLYAASGNKIFPTRGDLGVLKNRLRRKIYKTPVLGQLQRGAMGAGRVGAQVGRAGLNMANEKIIALASRLAARTGQPVERMIKLLQYGGGGAAGLGALSMMGGDEEYNNSIVSPRRRPPAGTMY